MNNNINDKLIVALDVPNMIEAFQLVERLGNDVTFYKVGLELASTPDYFVIINRLKNMGKKVFADMKLFDIPETVSRSISNLCQAGVDFVTVHGNDTIIKAAMDGKTNKHTKILAVTVLTSLDNTDIASLGFGNIDTTQLVLSRARKALNLKCDGIVCSGLELPRIRNEFHENLIVVVPGIRPVANTEDDQKRIVTVEQAFLNGADHIVVGRPIRDAVSPRDAAKSILQTIEQTLSA